MPNSQTAKQPNSQTAKQPNNQGDLDEIKQANSTLRPDSLICPQQLASSAINSIQSGKTKKLTLGPAVPGTRFFSKPHIVELPTNKIVCLTASQLIKNIEFFEANLSGETNSYNSYKLNRECRAAKLVVLAGIAKTKNPDLGGQTIVAACYFDFSPVGMVRATKIKGLWIITGLATTPGSENAGSALVEWFVQRFPDDEVRLKSKSRASSLFYQRLGFQQYGTVGNRYRLVASQSAKWTKDDQGEVHYIDNQNRLFLR